MDLQSIMKFLPEDKRREFTTKLLYGHIFGYQEPNLPSLVDRASPMVNSPQIHKPFTLEEIMNEINSRKDNPYKNLQDKTGSWGT